MGKIIDGTGHSYAAKVDGTGRLATLATTHPKLAHQSELGEAYRVAVGSFTLPASEAAIARFHITRTGYIFALSKLFVGWNGGNTNHNRAVLFRVYANMSEPSANYTSADATNMNTGKPNVSEITRWTWDGVGTGMTVASNGTLLAPIYMGQGTTVLELEGAPIITVGNGFGFTFEAEEIGEASIVLFGYMHADDEV